MPAGLKAQTEQWRRTAQRYESEPETNEGRKELMARAKAKEAYRDRSLAAYHMFEYGSACFQLAIVLAGAAALTAVAWLTFVSFGLGAVGIGFTVLGFWRRPCSTSRAHETGDNEKHPMAAAIGCS